MTDPQPDASSAGRAPAPGPGTLRTQAADYVALAKPRLNVLVVVTALAGYYMGVRPGTTGILLTCIHLVVGTALVASGSAVYNQLLEIEADGRMRRTRARPLPSGRLTPRVARVFASVLSLAGTLQLHVFLAFCALMVLSQAFISLLSILAFVQSERVFSMKYIMYLVALELVEFFWYRWLISIAKVRGTFEFLIRKKSFDQYKRENKVK